MVDVRSQYEAYPYPERDPADERRRLITGSPSPLREVDHYLFAGRRDWSQPFRVLVAGGGTGDGLIQIAQGAKDAGVKAEITYVDLSTAARQMAEARAKVRGLTGITFHTGSLLEAAELGRFDYIDCCGVLHHLPDPAAGFAALRAALAPGGGMGFMVYAPLGRSGVYPLQEAFGTLFAGLAPQARLEAARKVMAQVPEGHPFRTNPHLGDHQQSDAGFYDLLLHGQDRAFAVEELLEVMGATGWHLASFCWPALYELSRLVPDAPPLDPAVAMAVAEKLRGTFKVHVGYAAPEARAPATMADIGLVPHLPGTPPARLAQAVAQGRPLPLTLGTTKVTLRLPVEAAPLIAAVDGRRTLAEIATLTGADRFAARWAPVERELTGWGMLLYSGLGG
ncbi:MAG: methyltransferase [Limimaricola sp.]|uniref:class I SAM-dependent methyltransferase n=1 Tax=Limimaricola sp. TaxID=2211665 RepID=UPI001D8BDC46|nr:class I SAM-dependent methyltransferase [Limimaricola sp.]MBI1415746.1 methyltransferase [Limimaricola sp.]